MKFPSIPHMADADLKRFVGKSLVITEKLDGLNLRLHDGKVYDRAGEPHNAPWTAMVKKWHAYKTLGNHHLHYFGEDLYACHSCEYDRLPEDETFRVFIVAGGLLPFAMSYMNTVDVVKQGGLLTVPLLGVMRLQSISELRENLEQMVNGPSALGGEREGVVVRRMDGFFLNEAPEHMFKIVRDGHVQPDADHWRRNWRRRPLLIRNMMHSAEGSNNDDC